MIIAFALLAISLPANAAAGLFLARQNGWTNPEVHAGIAAIMPPYGAFCAITLLIQETE